MYPTFYVNLGPIKLRHIKDHLSAEIEGINPNSEFSQFVGIDDIKSIDNTISFVYENYQKFIDLPKNINLIISKKEKNKFSEFENLIIVDNVHEAVAKLSTIFYRDINDNDIKHHSCDKLDEECLISDSAIIKKGVNIGKKSIIKEGAVINNNCIIGNNTVIEENVVISNAIIGDNVRIGRNSSIGPIFPN